MSTTNPQNDPLRSEINEIVDRFKEAWRGDEPPRLEEFLPADPAQRLPALVELVHVDLEMRLERSEAVQVEQYRARWPELAADPAVVVELVAGEYQSRKARAPNVTTSEFLERFPQLADQIAQRLAAPVRPRRLFPIRLNCPHCQNPIEIVAENAEDEVLCPSCGSSFHLDPDRTHSWDKDKLPTLGKFELIEPLGRGAFGTVYRARDNELQRIVAVKVPRSGQLATSEDEDRFRREARHAAQLQHPGIVPVYEVGHSDTFTYIVSEYVDGDTLADTLQVRQFGFRDAAALVARVAAALQHAHDQGVVHRDLKPSNIMLTPEGQPRVMDFGLAKRDAGEITVTVEGQVLGTPAYMSPEQARGDSHDADARSDVYSLGVILYELLTGELPFRGKARMVLRDVQQRDPRAPRSLNDRIPRDLETICIKAMAKEPNRRYQTAQDLSDDLNRYLTGEPIQARPVGRIERGWRWCRRNPVIASLSTAVALALVSGTVISSYFAIRATAERDRADAQATEAIAERNRADKERQRAEAGFREARDTVDKYFTQVSESTLLNVPGMQPLRKELLSLALAHFTTFIEQHGGDPNARLAMADAYSRVGEITDQIGNEEEALVAMQTAVELFSDLTVEFPDDPHFQMPLGQCYARISDIQRKTARLLSPS